MDRRTAIRTLAAATAIPLASPTELARFLEARRALSAPNACGPLAPPFAPAALTRHEVELVRAVADILLPPTETPSASDVGVHEFIDLIAAEWFEPEQAARFSDGLATLDSTATELYGTNFLSSAQEEQLAIIAELDRDLAALRDSDPEAADETFFHWMRRLTLTGYFTSEEGMALSDYRIIPGRFEGCVTPGQSR